MTSLALVNAFALTAAAGWLATLTLPARQALRVRNAFLLRRGEPRDFSWTPERVPAGFAVERAAPPEPIAQAIADAGIAHEDGDWVRALALVTMLVRHARDEGPIQADLATTYRGIVNGSGYCSDFVRVYLAAGAAVGLFCRQWAFSFDGFGGHGHTFAEIYDSQRSAWAMVDVHNNVYAVRKGSEVALDASTLHDLILASPDAIEFRKAGDGRLGFPHAHKLLDYYRRGANEWYLWYGNDVISRERSGIATWAGALSGRLAHRLSRAVGRSPALVVMVTPDNLAAVSRMEALRSRVRIAAWLALALGALLLLQGLR